MSLKRDRGDHCSEQDGADDSINALCPPDRLKISAARHILLPEHELHRGSVANEYSLQLTTRISLLTFESLSPLFLPSTYRRIPKSGKVFCVTSNRMCSHLSSYLSDSWMNQAGSFFFFDSWPQACSHPNHFIRILFSCLKKNNNNFVFSLSTPHPPKTTTKNSAALHSVWLSGTERDQTRTEQNMLHFIYCAACSLSSGGLTSHSRPAFQPSAVSMQTLLCNFLRWITFSDNKDCAFMCSASHLRGTVCLSWIKTFQVSNVQIKMAKMC